MFNKSLKSQQSCPESGGGSPRSHEEDEDDSDGKEKALQTEALLCAFETLGKSWPRNPETQGKLELPLYTNPKSNHFISSRRLFGFAQLLFFFPL